MLSRTLISHGYYTIARWYSTPKLAIVGSGPAGMFACSGIIRKTNFNVDVFENAPVPFGLVRYGVAPDHQEMKNAINVFSQMFEKNMDRLRLYCNVQIGRDLSFNELTKFYDAVLLAYGSYKVRKLGIPGENAGNVVSGAQFVSWYNGVPNVKEPNLNVKNAIIIGNGNVALDCTRLLSTSNSATLRTSDIPKSRLDILEKSTVNSIKVMGRRGPENVSFTIKELKEQFRVPNWNSKIVLSEKEVKELSEMVETMERKKKRLTKVILENSGVAQGPNQCNFLFNYQPVEVLSDSNGNVKALRVLNKSTNEIEEVPCELLIYAIGYETLMLDGVPQNSKKMIDMMDQCRVNYVKDDCQVYATGWCAHGPKGVIVDTQQQSLFVSEVIAEDFDDFEREGAETVDDLLKTRKVPFVTWNDWKKIDAEEKEEGKKAGKIREKRTCF